MSEQNSIKITAEDRATFERHGKSHGAGANLTDGARVVVEAWRNAKTPVLPADPCAGRGACELVSVVRRWDEYTWQAFVLAGVDDTGASKGASCGARRLAAWARSLVPVVEPLPEPGLRGLVDAALALLERTPANDPLFRRLAGTR